MIILIIQLMMELKLHSIDKFIEKVIGDAVSGSEIYRSKEHTWLIFKDKKEWVVSVSDGGYLWYNYSFFNNLFKYLSLDLMDNSVHIKNWVINYLGVKVASHYYSDYLPDEYDWRNQFNVDEVLEGNCPIAGGSLRSV